MGFHGGYRRLTLTFCPYAFVFAAVTDTRCSMCDFRSDTLYEAVRLGARRQCQRLYGMFRKNRAEFLKAASVVILRSAQFTAPMRLKHPGVLVPAPHALRECHTNSPSWP